MRDPDRLAWTVSHGKEAGPKTLADDAAALRVGSEAAAAANGDGIHHAHFYCGADERGRRVDVRMDGAGQITIIRITDKPKRIARAGGIPILVASMARGLLRHAKRSLH